MCNITIQCQGWPSIITSAKGHRYEVSQLGEQSLKCFPFGYIQTSAYIHGNNVSHCSNVSISHVTSSLTAMDPNNTQSYQTTSEIYPVPHMCYMLRTYTLVWSWTFHSSYRVVYKLD